MADDSVVIQVACEAHPGDGESWINTIRVRWWRTRREEIEAAIKESPGIALEERLTVESELPTIDDPVISVDGGEVSEGVYPGRADVASLKGAVQMAILNELHAGGAKSMVFKDHKGRFVRLDGSRILDWQ